MVAGQMRAQLPAQLSLPTSAFGAKENQEALKVHIDRQLQIQIDGEQILHEELSQHLGQSDMQQAVAIYADASIKAAELADILLTIETAGVANITLVVENQTGNQP